MVKNRLEKYKFLFNGGDLVRKACFHICKSVWATEVYPKEWNVSSLVQLNKPNSDQHDLNGKRHINLKDPLSKVFSHIVVNTAKENF